MQVSSVHVYPVKSCRGISVNSAAVTSTGLQMDRRWMVVKEKNMTFVSQRSHPQMTQINTSIPSEAFLERGSALGVFNLTLTHAAKPSLDPLTVPLWSPINADGAPSSEIPQGAGLRVGAVWKWEGRVWDEGDDAADWLSAALHNPARSTPPERFRLVRHVGGLGVAAENELCAERNTDPEFAIGQVAFADGFPVLLVTEASLARVSEAAGVELQMARFRPNIVVAGADVLPFEEDNWLSVDIGQSGSVAGELVKPCSRCSIPNLNPETGERTEGHQPFEALRGLRSGEVLQDQPVFDQYKHKWKSSVFFGWNVVLGDDGQVNVGDSVAVTRFRHSGM